MKSLLACTGLLIAAATLSAQTPAPKPPPKSPAATESATIAARPSPLLTVRPASKAAKASSSQRRPDRPRSHYPVWRAGANAATKLHTEADLEIGSLAVPKAITPLRSTSPTPTAGSRRQRPDGQWGTVYDKAKDLGACR